MGFLRFKRAGQPMSDLFHILEELSNQLPGCKMASIVDLQTGMQLASVGGAGGAKAAGADAFQSELYNQLGGLSEALGAVGEPEMLVVESGQTTFVSELIGESGYLWHVATDAETTLGFTQAIMRKYRERVTQGVAQLVGG